MGRMAVFHVENGKSVQEASDHMVAELRQKTTGEAGLIMVDKEGNIGLAYDTPHMPVGILNSGLEKPHISIRPTFYSK